MIYCEKIYDYVEQDKKCIKCAFYIQNTDSCVYNELEKDKNEPNA